MQNTKTFAEDGMQSSNFHTTVEEIQQLSILSQLMII